MKNNPLTRKNIISIIKIQNNILKGSDNINKTKRLSISAIILVLIMSISGIYAINDNVVSDETFRTGSVDIELEYFTLNNDNEEKYSEVDKPVMPGDKISLIPKVHNLGEDCYLRIKIQFIDEDIDALKYITGFSDKMAQYGDYYYYQEQVNHNQTIKIFDAITIPSEILNESSEQKISLNVTAEAVQAKNFEPDYTKENPWNNVKPEKSIRITYDYEKDDSNNSIIIKYNGTTSNDVTLHDDIFKNISSVMPGDVLNEKIHIKNNNDGKTKYFINLGYGQKEKLDTELLNSIDLKITNNKGIEIYSGKIINSNDIMLGELESNQEEEFIFTIYFPIELGNKYELLNQKLIWTFSSLNSNSLDVPNTGDSIDIDIIIFLISSMCLAIVIVLIYTEKRKNNILK